MVKKSKDQIIRELRDEITALKAVKPKSKVDKAKEAREAEYDMPSNWYMLTLN
jgi:mannitol/fructose-specific phosphotransferase system IIA component (Ntr-type)